MIEKWSFTSDGNAADIADLTLARREPSSQSSSTHVYTCGGYTSGQDATIDKFSFSAASNATDVGDLLAAKYGVCGNQV